MPNLETSQRNDVVVATLINPLITSDDQIHEIGRELRKLFEQSPGKKVLLSFSNVKSMPSLMIGELLRLRRGLLKDNAKLRLCSLNPNVVESLQISGLYEMFEIDECEESGLDNFS